MKSYDQRADIYSLGVVYFEMLHDFKTLHQKVKEVSNFKSFGMTQEFISLFEKESQLIFQELICFESPLTFIFVANNASKNAKIDFKSVSRF